MVKSEIIKYIERFWKIIIKILFVLKIDSWVFVIRLILYVLLFSAN